MTKQLFRSFSAFAVALSLLQAAAGQTFRPPAVPLVAHDPYFSVWSMDDTLTGNWSKHWTGQTQALCGLVRIDGKTYRWAGQLPGDLPAMKQTSVKVEALTTTYTFEDAGVKLTVKFVSNVAPEDAVKASRTVSHVVVSADATDGKKHDVVAYMDVSGEWVVNTPDQTITWNRLRSPTGDVVSMGTVAQPMLAKTGDWMRIDWGRLYLTSGEVVAVSHGHARGTFARSGKLPAGDDLRTPRSANDDWPVMAARAAIDGKPAVFTLAYDDQRGIELFERQLRPYWLAKGVGLSDLLSASGVDAVSEAAKYDTSFRTAAEKFGPSYANMTTLAFRQVMAGHKICADWDGSPVMFSKENSSNGCIATVDVIYPACPFFLYHSPELLKAQLRPLMAYFASERWTFPFAPHDLGTYPRANGQVYGGGERSEENQMPVEESGNMLIMLAALAKVEKNADFSKPYIPTLERWAEYLEKHGLDPANQLCTDDFAGHMARNVNLSAKAIVALGAYAQLLEAAGETQKAQKWAAKAKEFAAQWQKMAKDGDGTMLAFGKPGTWSQKYNLIWDRVLGLNLFPQEVFEREMTLYKTKMKKYGLPLDSRRGYTKLDWTVWTACLTGKKADFDAIMGPVNTWVSEGPSRVPLTDWYETEDGRMSGFQARTVVGGVWMPMLMEKMGVPLK